jgi:hypothetical protein
MIRQKQRGKEYTMSKDEINLSEWYTAQEAAEKLGTTPKYVRTLAVQYGRFKTHKLHNRLMLYWKEDVDTYQIAHGKPGPRHRTGEKAVA